MDFNVHADLCVQFALDPTFGFPEKLLGADGLGGQRYIERMKEKHSADPESCLLVWRGNEVVGQMSLGRFIDGQRGYVHFFYVIPEWRGKGIAMEMDEFAADWFKKRGVTSAVLSVDPTNERAVRFYCKCGWTDLGPRPDRLELHNLEKSFG